MYRLRLLALLFVFSTAACDSTEAVDEDVTATKVTLILQDETSSEPVEWSAEKTAGLVDGITITEDTLVLPSGKTVSGHIELFGERGTDITQRIRSEAERYQLFYDVSGFDAMRVDVDDSETDYGTNQVGINLPVGLKISFTTPSTESATTGSLRIKIGYFRPGQKNGFTLTIDPVYDFIIPVRIEPDAPLVEPVTPPHLTTLRLDLVRQDDLKTISIEARREAGLNLQGGRIAGLVEIEACERSSVVVDFTCSDLEELTVEQGEHYKGYVTVVDRERGDAFTEYVRENQEEFRIFYELQFSPTGLTYDRDANGLPVGLEIDWQLPTNVQIGGGTLKLRMEYYATSAGGDKAMFLPTATLADFGIGFNLVEPTPPQSPITRFRLDLVRKDTLRTISVTAERPDGLDLLGRNIEKDFLNIEVCERTSAELDYTCEEADELTLHHQEHFTGSATIEHRESENAFTDHVRANKEDYQIFYQLQFTPTGMTYDEDSEGLPVGLEIDWVLPSSVTVSGGRLIIRMLEYDPQSGGDKPSQIPTATLMNFRLPFNLQL